MTLADRQPMIPPAGSRRLWRRAERILSVDDACFLARRRQPRLVYEWLEGGSGPARTLDANPRAFDNIAFRPRAATFYPARNLATTVVGVPVSLPVLTAPTGGIRVSEPEAEVAVARAVGRAGTVQILSTLAGCSIEEVVAAASGPVFYQLFFPGSRERAEAVIERAKHVGCAALVVTVDTPMPPFRERPYRRRLDLGRPTPWSIWRNAPSLLSRPAWLWRFARDRGALYVPMVLGDDGRPLLLWDAAAALFREVPVWNDLPWIRELWGGPLIVKGILSADDARRARDLGANAVVVSNHGGNILDGAPPTIRVLPEVVDAVGGEIEVLLDSGVRRGADVVKSLALGARAVLIGRAYVWGLAAAGEAGVSRILDLFREEIDRVLAELGCPSVSDLDRSYVRPPNNGTVAELG